jgi:hypothetical protein
VNNPTYITIVSQRWFIKQYPKNLCQSRSYLWGANPQVNVIASSLTAVLTLSTVSMSCSVGRLWFVLVIYVMLQSILQLATMAYPYVEISFYVNSKYSSSEEFLIPLKQITLKSAYC